MSSTQQLPWFVNTIGRMFSPNCDAGLPDGRWVKAVVEPYHALGIERLKAAWWVFTGRAHAFRWPEPGELEAALKDHRQDV